MMSSTPCSKAASLVRRSPRRVKAKVGIRVPPCSPERPSRCYQPVAADVHVDDGQVRAPLVECGRRLGNILRLTRGVDAVIERQLDDLADQGLIDQDQDARAANER